MIHKVLVGGKPYLLDDSDGTMLPPVMGGQWGKYKDPYYGAGTAPPVVSAGAGGTGGGGTSGIDQLLNQYAGGGGYGGGGGGGYSSYAPAFSGTREAQELSGQLGKEELAIRHDQALQMLDKQQQFALQQGDIEAARAFELQKWGINRRHQLDLERTAVEQHFSAQQSHLDRVHDRYSRESQKAFQAGENAKGREFEAQQLQVRQQYESLENQKQREFQAIEAVKARLDAATEAGKLREFQAEESRIGRTFAASESALGREFTAGESALGREFQGVQAELGRAFTGEQAELGRQLTREESAFTRAHAAAESALGRALTASEGAAVRALTASEGAAGRALTASESALGRTHAAGESVLGREFQAGESELGREFQREMKEEEIKAERQRIFTEMAGRDPVRAMLFAMGVGGEIFPGGERFEGLEPMKGAEERGEVIGEALTTALKQPLEAQVQMQPTQPPPKIELGESGVTGLPDVVKAATAYQKGGLPLKTTFESAFGVGAVPGKGRPGVSPEEFRRITQTVTPRGTIQRVFQE